MEANQKLQDGTIEHRNSLWFLYRQMAESEIENTCLFHLYDKINRKKGERKMKKGKKLGVTIVLCIIGMSLLGCSTGKGNLSMDLEYNEDHINHEWLSQQGQPESEYANTETPSSSVQPADTQKPADTQPPSTTNPQNVFYDPNAAQYHMNNVHMQPGRVYWDNGHFALGQTVCTSKMRIYPI